MSGGIYRTHNTGAVTIADNGTASTLLGVPMDLNDGIVEAQGYAYGAVQVPTGWVAADITFLVSNRRDGTYTILCKEDGTVVKIDVDNANRWYAIPPEAFMCAFWKIQSSDQATPTSTVSQTGGPLTLLLSLGA